MSMESPMNEGRAEEQKEEENKKEYNLKEHPDGTVSMEDKDDEWDSN